MAIGTRELLATLKIDPEFEGKIPPLTEAEFEQLRENILDAGEVYEPIRVWNGTVVDGHNRLRVVRENSSIKWQTRDMEFADKWAAFDWMYRNQLGRRNLTDEQRTYMIGKMYEARKKSRGGTGANQYNSKVQNAQNGPSANRNDKDKHGVSGEMAVELNIGRNTVRRAEKFAKGVDMLRKLSPESADKVLKGKTKATKTQIATFGELASESQEQVAPEIVKAIEKGESLPATTMKNAHGKPRQELQPETTTADLSTDRPKKRNYSGNAELRELYRTIDEAYAPMIDQNAPSTFDINDLKIEIDDNGEMFLSALRSTIESRKYLLVDAESKQIVFNAIANIMQGITKLRGEYMK